MKVAWATDIHLNFVEEPQVAALCADIDATGAHAVLLGGDIAEAESVGPWLGFMAARLHAPIYFVLGNHDYYGSDIETVRQAARSLASEGVHWLPSAGVVPLSPEAALVGHGGWGDARHGDFMGSEVILNDYAAIRDLRCLDGEEAQDPLAGWNQKPRLRRVLQALGDDAAVTLRPALMDALTRFPEVVVLTHVPPFKEACWHQGRISGDEWLPGFTCKAVGDLLLEAADAHAERAITVLCGHTHGEGEARPRPNLHVITGGAMYGRPVFRTVDVRGEP